MRNLRVWNSVILGGYGLALLLLAYFFFVHETQSIPYWRSPLANDFMVRFSSFWFISFLLTIMVYLLNLSLNYLRLPRTEKLVAMKAGKIMLALGVCAALVAVIIYTELDSL